MIDQQLRRVSHRLLGGVSAGMSRAVGPMPVTLTGLILGLAAAAAVALGAAWIGLALWLLNRLVDGIDGEVARARGESSDFGGYVDMMSDVVVYAAIPLAVAFNASDPRTTGAILLMMCAFYINITSWSYLSALIEKRKIGDHRRKTAIEMPQGLIEGSETIVIYALLIAVSSAAAAIAAVAAVLALLTSGQRLLCARYALSSHDETGAEPAPDSEGTNPHSTDARGEISAQSQRRAQTACRSIRLLRPQSRQRRSR